MAVEASPSLKSVIGYLPLACYENPTWKGLLYFGRDVTVYVAAVIALLSTDHVLLLVPLWLLAGLAISALFVVGHDAAHGALFRSQRLCYVVGQLALLPSLHAYAVWTYGHNRIHHGHTACKGIDFVWHPLTIDQYRSLSWLGRLRHRFEWGPCGAGAYYARVVWWNKMMRGDPPRRLRGAFRRDRFFICSAFAAFSLGLLAVGYTAGGATAAIWTWIKVFAVPWLLWNYFIGGTVYVHHIHPDILWHPRRRWTKIKGQMEATTNYRLPGWLNFFWHNIYLHVPHHVDTRIPFYGLAEATRAIARHLGDGLEEKPIRLTDYFATTRHCKLYDFDRGTWVAYDGEIVASSSLGVSKNAKIPFDELRVSGKILSKWISNRSG